jgi:hypothetical protein
MAVLLLIFFTLACLILFFLDREDIGIILLKGFLITFFLIGFGTELLSLFNKITYNFVFFYWLLLIIIAFLSLISTWYIYSKKFPDQESLQDKESTGSGWVITLCLTLILIVSSVTLFIAVKSPPNNFDSMTYHMARVSHWIQDQNIRYFPTAIPRQNYSMPLAEYAILHLQILSKGDHYANLIQWFSFSMAILITTLIAKDLKVPPRGQWITGALAATLPMAILQSSSTQNDLVVSAFCLAFVYFLIRSISTGKWFNILLAALSMGFALATKGTAYIFIAAAGLGIGGGALLQKDREQIKKLLFRYSMIIVIGLILNAGIYMRNFDLYRNPLITSNERIIVEEISPRVLFANLVRNGAVHLSSPIETANQFVENKISGLLGSELNNPKSTFQESKFELSFSINEDEAGNGLHLILMGTAVLSLPWLKTDHKKDWMIYGTALIFSYLLFSLVFKWQPWGGRLQTPIFLLGCSVSGYFLDKVFRKDGVPVLILITFLITSTPFLLLNSNRPILPLWEDSSVFYDTEIERKIYTHLEDNLDRVPKLAEKVKSILSVFYEGRSIILTERKELYFLGNFEDFYWYNEACHLIRNTPAREIGLIMDSNDWEYPLWVLLKKHAVPGNWIMYHIDMDDISNTIPQDYRSKPGIILVTRDDYLELDILKSYDQIYSSASIQVYQNKAR